MFGKKKEDQGPIIEAQAIVTSIADTGTTVNGNPRVKLTLQVQPDGGELRQAGALTDEEFEQQKAKVLADT